MLEITHTNVSTVAVTPIIPTSDRDYGFDKFHVPVASIALSDGDDSQLWGEDGFSFGDLVDLINPLQHIPGVATLYREFTGDQIAPGARLLGGTLFGGIGGAVSALVNVVVEDATGKDVGEHIVAFATGGDASGSDGTPVSPTLASNDEYPSANEPYQIAGLAAPAVPSTPAATEGKTASAASGAELLHTLTQANVILLIRDTPPVGMYVLNMFCMRGSRLWGSRLHRACVV